MRAKPAHFAQTLVALAAACTLAACSGAKPALAPATGTPPDPAEPPADVHWETYEGVRLPIGGHDGPSNLGTTATGYSHSPQGAALAAINHSTRLSLAPDGEWPQLAAESLVPGPSKDAWVLARAQISITAPIDQKVAPRIAGYKVTSYRPDRTDLTVYSTYSDKSITASAETVLWASGDWRLLLPDPAAKIRTVQSVPVIPPDAVKFDTTK